MIAENRKPTMLREARWLDSGDHRSLQSAPALAAKQLLSEWPYVIFLSFAKSGSKITDDDSTEDVLEQLQHVQEVVGNQRIDALLISAGGNDVGFANTLSGLTKGDLGQGSALDEFKDGLLILRGGPRNDPLFPQGYPRIKKTIEERLNVSSANVLIGEYPGHLFNRDDNLFNLENVPMPGCGVFTTTGGAFLSIGRDEATSIDSMGELLNAEVELAADTNDWHFVGGIAEQFESRGYCAPNPLYISAEDSCDYQGDFDGTMHPNQEGTEIVARAISRELRSVLPRQDTILIEPPG